MKYTQLVEGEFYTTNYLGQFYILRHKDRNAFNITGKSFYYGGGNFSLAREAEFFPATEFEKQHLLACITANKFVPLEKVLFNPEIY